MTARRSVAALAAVVCLAACGSTANAGLRQGVRVPVTAGVSPSGTPQAPPPDMAFAALTSPGTQLQAPVQIPAHSIRLQPAPRDAHPNMPATKALANPVIQGMFGSKPATSLGVKLGVLYDQEIRHLNADGSSTKLYYGITVWAVSGTVISEPSGPSPAPSGSGLGPHGAATDGAAAAGPAHLVVFIAAGTGRYLFAVEGGW